MTLTYALPIVEKAERIAETGDIAATWRVLRDLPLADFLSMPSELSRQRFPALAKMTPTMPSADVQTRWTGHSGQPLLSKSCGTLRLIQLQSLLLRGRDLGAGPILDYGCGWGRLMRGLGYFADPDMIHGADPMEASLAACREHKVIGNLHKVPTIPGPSPLPVSDFDMVFSYSVMTHTSMDSTRAVLRAIRSIIAEDGLYATTIRPVEFWTMRAASLGQDRVAGLPEAHARTGYAFIPLGGGGELVKQDYGDSSYSIETFGRLADETGWRIARLDRDTLEPWQLTVTLRPA